MEKVKLTLSIENHLISLAKEVAKSKNTSVSELVSTYLATFKTTAERVFESEELYGIAKSNLSQKSDMEIKAIMMKEKYGI